MKDGRRAVYMLSGLFLAAMLMAAGCGKTKTDAEGTVAESTQTTVESGASKDGDGILGDADSTSADTDGTSNDAGKTEVTDEKDPAGTDDASDSSKKTEKTPGIASPSRCGSLQVKGTALTDQDGNPVQLRGISTHGLAWFPGYVNEDCFRELREDWQANVIRLAMYTAENGGYCTDGDKDKLKKLVQDGVAYATENDMYVIIDWHVLSDQNPNTYIDESKNFFREMSALYADYNNVIYEICNEPNGGTGWQDIKTYAEVVIPVIRENDENAVILVGTPNWSQYVDQAAADPITGYSNIMYTLHFYAATHTDWLRETMTKAVNAGLPIFVSEYGICDASGNGAIDETQADKWVDAMDALGISYVAWNLSNKSETSAIFSSSCGKTSGFMESDLSDSGKWLYHMLTEKGAAASGGTAGGSGASDMGKADASGASGTGTAGGSGASGTGTAGGSGASGTGTASGSGASGTGNAGASATGSVSGTSLTYTVEMKNSWESEGKTFYQYDISVTNTGSSDCSTWKLDITFTGDITVQNSWSGNYSVDGSTLHVTPVDYNSTIAAGATIKDIGVIVSGKSGLAVK